MNKNSNLSLLSILFSFVVFYACSKKTEDPPKDPPKTLNKALLVGKKWYNDAGNSSHDIRANGVYWSSGTWAWKNPNSDTIIFDFDGPNTLHPSEEWKIFWTAEHEMACRKVNTGTTEILYKDQPW